MRQLTIIINFIKSGISTIRRSIQRFVFDMKIIPLNMHIVIRKKLFQDDIEDVAAGSYTEESNILGVF